MTLFPAAVLAYAAGNVHVYPLPRGVSKDIFFIDNLLLNQKKMLGTSQDVEEALQKPLLLGNLTLSRQQGVVWPPCSLSKVQWRGLSEGAVLVHPLSTFYGSIKGTDFSHVLFQWAVVVGNFQYAPFYIALGQHNAGFGFYYTKGIEKPLTSQLGYMPNNANVSLGWKKTWIPNCTFQILASCWQDAGTLGFQHYIEQPKWSIKTGVSYATDVVNAHWKKPLDSKPHFVNAYWMLDASRIQIVLEGITTLKHYEQYDITPGCNRPVAATAELSCRHMVYHHPLTLTINYGYGAGYAHGIRFDDVHNKGIPVNRIGAAIKTPFKTLYMQLSIGFKRDWSAQHRRNALSVQVEAGY